MPDNIILISFSVFLALLPALIWGGIFLYKHGEKRSEVLKIFLVGGTMVIPLMVYRFLWGIYPKISIMNLIEPLKNKEIALRLFDGGPNLALPISMIILFLTIGIIEEVLKGLVAKGADREGIKTIDDAIEFSIIAGLGFAFAENTFYFMEVWRVLGYESLLQVFVFRAVFSTFAHVMFSAVFGYHLGLAIFAKDVYREKKRNSFTRSIITKLSRLTRMKSEDIFEDQQIFIGLFYASVLHAIFNVLLELNFTRFLIPFLVIGVIHVMLMITNSKNHIEYK